MNNAKQIAGEILRQLGHAKFKAMTGAKELVTFEDLDSKRAWPGLAFKLPLGKVRVVRIALSPDDTYTIQFFTRKREDHHELFIEELEGIYCDQLKDTIEHYTGLRLSL
jgi:hypothetical protein